jgi:hypothetical protein
MVASLQVKIIPPPRRKGRNEALIFLFTSVYFQRCSCFPFGQVLTFFIKEKSEAGLGGKPKVQ